MIDEPIGSTACVIFATPSLFQQAGRNGPWTVTLSAVGRQPTGRKAMFQSRNDGFQSRTSYREEQAANLMVAGLLCLFAFVVLFVFISLNSEMSIGPDPAKAQVRGIETTGSSRNQ
jgi:hypothetical protein